MIHPEHKNYISYYIHFRTTAEESRYFTSMNMSRNITNTGLFSVQPWSQETYIYIYTGIVASIFFIGITRSFAFYALCMRASQRLHDMVFGALIRTGMRFFDTNPSGRILNRFSKDMSAIDELLPKATLDAGQIVMMMCGTLIVTCIVNYLYVIPIVVLGAVFYWIRKVYLRTSKNVKRLEGMSKFFASFRIFNSEIFKSLHQPSLNENMASGENFKMKRGEKKDQTEKLFCLVFCIHNLKKKMRPVRSTTTTPTILFTDYAGRKRSARF